MTRRNLCVEGEGELLVRLTRQWPHFHLGASPRAGIALVQGARTLAAFRGRDYTVPDDVVEIIVGFVK